METDDSRALQRGSQSGRPRIECATSCREPCALYHAPYHVLRDRPGVEPGSMAPTSIFIRGNRTHHAGLPPGNHSAANYNLEASATEHASAPDRLRPPDRGRVTRLACDDR